MMPSPLEATLDAIDLCGLEAGQLARLVQKGQALPQLLRFWLGYFSIG
jgi:hypothetical protein